MTTEATPEYDVAIIGGGICGLAAAWDLRDRNIVVLEGDDRLGGRAMSLPRGEYWVNLGPHLFGGPGTPLGNLVAELGLETESVPGDTMAIAIHGRVIKGGSRFLYPFRLPLSWKGRLSLIRAGLKIERATKQRHKEFPTLEPATAGREKRLKFMGDETFADWLGKLDPDVDALFRVVSQRLTAESEELTAGAGVELFAHVWAKESDLARNLRGGTYRFVEALAHELGERVVVGAPVSNVIADKDGVTIDYTVGGRARQARAKAVIFATKAQTTARLAPGLPAETLDALNAMKYGTFVVGGIVTAETGPMPWDGIYAVAAVNRSFNMLFNTVNITRTGPRKPGGSLMVYGGGGLGDRLLQKTDDEIRVAFTKDIEEIFPQAKGVIQEIIIRRLPGAQPFPFPGRHKYQAALERDLGNIFLAGDYLEFPHMETSVVTAKEAAVKARKLVG